MQQMTSVSPSSLLQIAFNEIQNEKRRNYVPFSLRNPNIRSIVSFLLFDVVACVSKPWRTMADVTKLPENVEFTERLNRSSLFFLYHVILFYFQSCSRCLSFWSKYVYDRKIGETYFESGSSATSHMNVWNRQRQSSYCFATTHCCCVPSFGCVSYAHSFANMTYAFSLFYSAIFCGFIAARCRNSPIELITFGHLTIALISHLHYGVPCTNKWMLCSIPDRK